MTENEKANLQLAMTMLEHLTENSSSGILEILTPDGCEFHIGSAQTGKIVPWHGVHVGHDQIRTYLNKRRQYLHRDNCGSGTPKHGEPQRPGRGDGKGGDVEYIVRGDTVVVIGQLTDSFKEEPRSHMYTSDFVLVFRIVEGKIKKFQYFHDTDAVVQAWHKRYPGCAFAREP